MLYCSVPSVPPGWDFELGNLSSLIQGDTSVVVLVSLRLGVECLCFCCLMCVFVILVKFG